MKNISKKYRVLAFAVLFVLLPFIIFGSKIDDLVEYNIENFDTNNVNFLILTFFLAIDAVVPMPSSLVAASAALRLDPLFALITISVGTFLSSIVCFFIGRSLSRSIDRSHQSAQIKPVGVFDVGGELSVFLTRGVPVLAETTAIVAGSQCDLKRFVVVAAISSFLLSCLYVFLAGVGQGYARSELLVMAGSVLVPLLVGVVALIVQNLVKIKVGDNGRLP